MCALRLTQSAFSTSRLIIVRSFASTRDLKSRFGWDHAMVKPGRTESIDNERSSSYNFNDTRDEFRQIIGHHH